MLTIYRRHLKGCPHREKGRKYRRCQCPIWADGLLAGHELRKSLGLRDWQKAQELIRAWETEGRSSPAGAAQAVTIEQALESFLADGRARNLREPTLAKYLSLARQLRKFTQARGLRFLQQFDLETLGIFRSSWRDHNLAALKKLGRLRAFFHFALERKWIAENPARLLKNPKVTPRPTMPFTHEEMVRILAAIDQYADKFQTTRDNALRLRAFVLLLRYSGMRIGDVVSCTVARIVGSKLFLYTQKTGVPVECVLPDFVVGVLAVTPRKSDRYFFWTGEGKLQTSVVSWGARLRRLFKLAGVSGGHAHRFRDTFAVELLLAGIPIERVSVLLGQNSVRVTEAHYNPWVRARQEHLEADIRRAWANDPIVLLETAKGTREVREKAERVN